MDSRLRTSGMTASKKPFYDEVFFIRVRFAPKSTDNNLPLLLFNNETIFRPEILSRIN
jgi:hypothetical protein